MLTYLKRLGRGPMRPMCRIRSFAHTPEGCPWASFAARRLTQALFDAGRVVAIMLVTRIIGIFFKGVSRDFRYQRTGQGTHEVVVHCQ